MSTVFSCLRNPLNSVTDNSVQFISTSFTSFLQERQLTHHRSSRYYPAANGAIERFNRVLKQNVQLAIQQHQQWKQAVIEFLHVYRATLHATTGSSPYELLHCRPMWTNLTVLPLSSGCTPHAEMDIRCRQQQKMKTYIDSRQGARPLSFQRGDKVHVWKPLHVMKGHKRYTEPLSIHEKIGDSTYFLRDVKTWNASHLTAFLVRAATADRDIKEPVIDSPPRMRRGIQKPVWLKDYVP